MLLTYLTRKAQLTGFLSFHIQKLLIYKQYLRRRDIITQLFSLLIVLRNI